MRYRKKPLIVNAFRLGYEVFPEWFYCEYPHKCHPALHAITLSSDGGMEAVIRTLEGEMTAHKGDYIIFGINGEIYPVKADIFEKTYERVEDNGK